MLIGGSAKLAQTLSPQPNPISYVGPFMALRLYDPDQNRRPFAQLAVVDFPRLLRSYARYPNITRPNPSPDSIPVCISIYVCTV